MQKPISEFPTDPIYNMKAVEQQTGISAATIRAWEKRFTLIDPKRTSTGYRLYSERDVAMLRWIRAQMDAGLNVGRVEAVVESMQQNGEELVIDTSVDTLPKPIKDSPAPASTMVEPLFHALIDFDSERANELIEQAFAMFTIPTVYIDLIAPALDRVEEAWHNREIYASRECFARTYLHGRLLMLLQAYQHQAHLPMIFVGCSPTERHEISPLIFVLLLRQQGYNAIYLGPDVPLDDLILAATEEHPVMLCCSAQSESAALLLKGVEKQLNQAEAPVPIFAYSGQAFDNNPTLRRTVPGHYLGSDPRDSVSTVANLIRAQRDT